MKSMKKISIVIPVYNEAGNLEALRNALLPLLDNKMYPAELDWEVILIDDGSRDDSLTIMNRLSSGDSRFISISLSRNFGKESAMLAGLDYASGNAVIIMDADLQHPVATIPKMLELWEQGYDDVYGRRLSRDTDSWIRRKLSRAYYKILKRISDNYVLPDVGDFRLLSRSCVNALKNLRETQRYSKGLFCWIGFRKAEVTFECNDRNAGKSSFSSRRLLNLAIEGITSSTTAPLRIASVVGITTAVAALVYLIYVIVKTLIFGESVQGYPTIICLILFLGGIQLIALGIIGEYISRIFNETKGRPVYIIRSINGDTDMCIEK